MNPSRVSEMKDFAKKLYSFIYSKHEFVKKEVIQQFPGSYTFRFSLIPDSNVIHFHEDIGEAVIASQFLLREYFKTFFLNSSERFRSAYTLEILKRELKLVLIQWLKNRDDISVKILDTFAVIAEAFLFCDQHTDLNIDLNYSVKWFMEVFDEYLVFDFSQSGGWKELKETAKKYYSDFSNVIHKSLKTRKSTYKYSTNISCCNILQQLKASCIIFPFPRDKLCNGCRDPEDIKLIHKVVYVRPKFEDKVPSFDDNRIMQNLKEITINSKAQSESELKAVNETITELNQYVELLNTQSSMDPTLTANKETINLIKQNNEALTDLYSKLYMIPGNKRQAPVSSFAASNKQIKEMVENNETECTASQLLTEIPKSNYKHQKENEYSVEQQTEKIVGSNLAAHNKIQNNETTVSTLETMNKLQKDEMVVSGLESDSKTEDMKFQIAWNQALSSSNTPTMSAQMPDVPLCDDEIIQTNEKFPRGIEDYFWNSQTASIDEINEKLLNIYVGKNYEKSKESEIEFHFIDEDNSDSVAQMIYRNSGYNLDDIMNEACQPIFGRKISSFSSLSVLDDTWFDCCDTNLYFMGQLTETEDTTEDEA